jgi:hypothetical protein
MIYHPDDPLAVAPYFTDLATYLEQNYETSTAGLLTVPLPSLDDLLQMVQFAVGGVLINPVDGQSLPDLGSSGFSQPFQMWHGEIGVTDIYSVFGAEGYSSSLSQFGFFVPTTNSGNIIDVYPTLGTLLNSWLLSPPGWTYPDLTVAQQNVYRWFRIRMRLGNLARWKGLYLAKGYDSVWSFIQKLRALSAGQPGAPGYNSPPTPGPAATDRNAHWCLSDFDAIISELDGSISELDGNYGVGYTYSNYYNWTLTHASQEGEFATSITAENIITRLRGVIDTSTDYASPQNISIGQRPPLPLPTPPRPLSLRQTILAAAI